MTTTIRITPLEVNSEQVLTCKYQVGNKVFQMEGSDPNGLLEYKIYDLTDRTIPSALIPPALQLVFNKTNRDYRISYVSKDPNEEGDSRNVIDKNREIAIKKVLYSHPEIMVDMKARPDLAFGRYNLVNESLQAVNNFKLWELQIQVVNAISKMALDKLRSVGYYYNIPKVKDLSSQELKIKLADFKDGAIFLDESVVNDFLKVWVLGESINDRNYQVNMEKALSYGVISEVKDNGFIRFYLGQEMMGHNNDDILHFLKNHEDRYNYMVNQITIQEKSLVKEEVKTEAVMQTLSESGEGIVHDKKELVDKIKKLRAEGYIDPIQGWHTKSVEQLLVWVEEAENNKRNALTG